MDIINPVSHWNKDLKKKIAHKIIWHIRNIRLFYLFFVLRFRWNKYKKWILTFIWWKEKDWMQHVVICHSYVMCCNAYRQKSHLEKSAVFHQNRGISITVLSVDIYKNNLLLIKKKFLHIFKTRWKIEISILKFKIRRPV